MTEFHDLKAPLTDGRSFDFAQLKGKAVLVVNVASQCGFTPQYEGLEALYRRYKDRGLEILGFPCNQFGGQEPGTDADIASFCTLNYGVTFPIFKKVDVNGNAADPVWRWLKAHAPGLLGSEAIKWNFTKFLVSRDGRVVERYAPTTTPEDLAPEIEKALA